MNKGKNNKNGLVIFLFLVCLVGILTGNIFFIIMIFFLVSVIVAISNMANKSNQVSNIKQLSGIRNDIMLKCTKCGGILKVTDKFCGNCGEPFTRNNANLSVNLNETLAQSKVVVTQSNFDSIFKLNEDKMVEEFINRQLIKSGIDKNTNLVPEDILKRRKVLNIIFSVLVFVFVFLIFFHFPIYTYAIGLIILFIFYRKTKKIDIVKYIEKQIKARPSEKITNIVMSVKSTSVVDNSKNIFLVSICLSVIIPLFIFWEPRILYEKVDNGYVVRFYTFGVTNFTTVTIPETYRDEKVVGLRGNTFSNMFFLKTVSLPDTITEIRGQAFKNDKSLTNVNIPTNLEYLGGGAFYNCSSLVSIEIPNMVTYMGGEAFYNAKSLESVKLSNNITEIRGNTFENCSSLKSIIIPDSVTRIGGHAFYGCSSLSEVIFTENSQLNEIGSSAFRQCTELYNITVPSETYINYRAFKESPTIIKRFGEIAYGSLIDESDYTNSGYIYISVGESEEINKYKKSARLQDAYISLEKVISNNDSNGFILKYSDTNGEEIFTLFSEESYKIINNNVAVELAADYVLNYDNRVSLKTYYN